MDDQDQDPDTDLNDSAAWMYQTGNTAQRDPSEVSSSAAWVNDAQPLGEGSQRERSHTGRAEVSHGHGATQYTLQSQNDLQLHQSAREEQSEDEVKGYGAPLDTQQSEGRSTNNQLSARATFTAADPKMQFETFDTSKEERREEKFIFKHIQRMNFAELEKHLRSTRDKFDIMQIYDKSGYTPIHYAAYKNIDRAVEIIIKFVLSEEFDRTGHMNGGSGETEGSVIGDSLLQSTRSKRKERLRVWLNSISRGDDGFTALHFASFHGNMTMIRMLVKHGADIHAQNK